MPRDLPDPLTPNRDEFFILEKANLP